MRVLLIDDHPLILAALESVIRTMGDNVTVLGVDTAEQARLALKTDDQFDLVLLDLKLGDESGFDVLKELRQAHPALPVVVISASERASDVIRAIDMGAMGFVPKKTHTETLFEALEMVMGGGIYVPSLTQNNSASPSSPSTDTGPSTFGGAHDTSTGGELHSATLPLQSLGLTPRQHDVLMHLLKGRPNKIIARELNLSVETVKDHVAGVLRALNVATRTEAVVLVSELSRKSRSRSGQLNSR
jgi:DNA-binding NarL/FixJ family response regulator